MLENPTTSPDVMSGKQKSKLLASTCSDLVLLLIRQNSRKFALVEISARYEVQIQLKVIDLEAT